MIVKAQGDAEAIKLVSEAISKNPGFLELRKIEMAKDVADILSQSSNKIFLSSDALLVGLAHIKAPPAKQ